MIRFLYAKEEWISLYGYNIYAAYYCIIFRKIPRNKQARAVASFSTKFLEKYTLYYNNIQASKYTAIKLRKSMQISSCFMNILLVMNTPQFQLKPPWQKGFISILIKTFPIFLLIFPLQQIWDEMEIKLRIISLMFEAWTMVALSETGRP